MAGTGRLICQLDRRENSDWIFLFFVCGIAQVYGDKMPSTDAFMETANIYHGSSWNSVKDFLQYFSSLGYRTTVIFVL